MPCGDVVSSSTDDEEHILEKMTGYMNTLCSVASEEN